MATLKQNAQYMIDVAREGIGWIALWKDGKGWMSMDFYPDIDRQGRLNFEDYDIDSLQNIAKLDPRAILVNGWYHNLGDTTCMTYDSLAAALRWQYDLQHYTVADAINCGAHV
jgi:hypothetical protein